MPHTPPGFLSRRLQGRLHGRSSLLCALLGLVGLHFGACARVQHADDSDAPRVLDHEVARIDGDTTSLDDYAGDVLLIVNVASECGFTPQYEGLQGLYEQKKDDGLVVLGFPSNDFMGQEPGTNEEIAEFCESRFGVTFPMFAKIPVTGDKAHPLFAEMNGAVGAPTWNFNKYLVDREGAVVARYGSNVAPDDPELVAHIDRLLEES